MHFVAAMITSLSQLDINKEYTCADYLTWKFEEYVELIKGKVLRMVAPNRYHQKVSLNLSRVIANHIWKSRCARFDCRNTFVGQQPGRNER